MSYEIQPHYYVLDALHIIPHLIRELIYFAEEKFKAQGG